MTKRSWVSYTMWWKTQHILLTSYLEEGFPLHIVDALRCLTKLSEDEPYESFIQRVKTNPLAKAVKINDLTDNMDIRRLQDMTDSDVKRLRKYLRAYQELTSQQ